MHDFILQISYAVIEFFYSLQNNKVLLYALIPMILLFEMPLTIIVLTGMFKWFLRHRYIAPLRIQPNVSCIITCYTEGEAISKTIITLCEQIYPGHIEIIAVIDDAAKNYHTYEAALNCQAYADRFPNRTLIIVPKWQRGGRVSTLNTGLFQATGEIIMNADGDTSFDNDMMVHIIREFEDPDVPAVAGALRVRNAKDGLATRMQALEYMIALEGNKTGLGEWNLINNVSGAFGAFRADFLRQIGGWNTHTAEDLDLTIRIKQYFKRFPHMHIPFAAHAIGHTDVPENFNILLKQRLRWDGDLVFLYLRKHRKALTPKLLGFKTYIFTVMFGVLQHVLLPVIMMMFNIWAIYTLDAELLVPILVIQYIYYFGLSVIHYVAFLIFISERPLHDLKMSGWIFLYPVYTFFMRLYNCFAIINEVVRRGHEESAMAPWWVFDKGNKF